MSGPFEASTGSRASDSSKTKRSRGSKARVRRPDTSADLALSTRQDKQREAVVRFTHKTFRTDWEELLRELFRRVVDGCPFAVGLFTVEAAGGVPVLRGWYNYSAGREGMADYVRRHFKRGHYEQITSSLEGLAPHEHFDLYKIVSSGLGLPVNSLVYRIEHYQDPQRKSVIVFGGERLEGQMEVHLKLAGSILEQPEKPIQPNASGDSEESRYARLIALLRASDPRKLRQAGPDERRWAEAREIVRGLEGIADQFPELLKTKFALLRKLLAGAPPPTAPEGKSPAPAPKD
jgi:hypothetical protein